MLRLPRFQLHSPATVIDAAKLLREHRGSAQANETSRGPASLGVMLVAGGTDVYPKMKRRQFTPSVLVSLQRVERFDHISNGTGLRIGAGATLTRVASYPAVRERYTALAEAADHVSAPQLRNMGTIGGNVCLDTRCNWYDQSQFWRIAEGFCMKTHENVVCRVATSSPRCLATASADTVPALMALGARVVIASADGERETDIAALYEDDGIEYLRLARDEIVTEIVLPELRGWRSTYLKLRDRGSFDFPLVGVAAAVKLDGRTVTEARVALTATASRPMLVDSAAAALVGNPLDDAAIEAAADAVHKAARPMDNTAGTIPQRKRTARVFAERALRQLRDVT